MKHIYTFLFLLLLSCVAQADDQDLHQNWDGWRESIDRNLQWCRKDVPEEVKTIRKLMGYKTPSTSNCAFWTDYSNNFDRFLEKQRASDTYFQSTWYFNVIKGEPEDVYAPEEGWIGYEGIEPGVIALFADILECKAWQQKALQVDMYVGKCISNSEEPLPTILTTKEQLKRLFEMLDGTQDTSNDDDDVRKEKND